MKRLSALVSADRIIVVDTGFDRAMADKRGRTLLKPLTDGLRAVGIEPSTVEDVLITHMHYDHCGNHNLFPKARFHVQDREMRFVTGRLMTHAAMRVPFEEDDVVAMVRRVFNGRVVFHDGDDEIAPGVSVDSLKNGALIGAGVGFGLGLAAGGMSCKAGCRIGVGFYVAGLGAGIGVGIDALIPSKQTIYIGRTPITLNLRTVRPVLGASRKGVSVEFSF